MNFGEALTRLNEGTPVARSGWNGKNMHIYLVGAGRYPPSTPAGEAIAAEHDDGLVPYLPYIAMKTVTGEVVPWLASQTDILADDWQSLIGVEMRKPVEEPPYPQTKNWLEDPEEDDSVGAELAKAGFDPKTGGRPAPEPVMALVTEQELQKKSTGARVTEADVEAFIVSEQFFTAAEGVAGARKFGFGLETEQSALPTPLTIMTFCVLTLANGFNVTGVSACADPTNFDRNIGERLARRNAWDQIWALLVFELRTKLALVDAAQPRSFDSYATYVGTKVVHATPTTRGAYNAFRGWPNSVWENPADEGYLIEYADGGQPNVIEFNGYVSWAPKDVFERSYSKIRDAG